MLVPFRFPGQGIKKDGYTKEQSDNSEYDYSYGGHFILIEHNFSKVLAGRCAFISNIAKLASKIIFA
jgi:hypothetical protein